MGGHGGLNILPQKRWNVYNRDNRLKVARDEAAHEQREQDIKEKHNAAEREHRRLELKRARQRHGGAASINLDTLQAEGVSKFIEEDVPESSTRHLVSQRDEIPLPGDAIDGGEGGITDPMRSHPHPSKRQKREKKPDKNQKKTAPSLAELARQLDTASPRERTETELEAEAPPAAATITTATKNTINAVPTAAEVPPVQGGHFNLFAEEEARAKNPEKTAEQRLLLSNRGDVKTHTSDAKFDQSFQLAYGLGGTGTNEKAPWYAQHPSSKASLTAVEAAGDDVAMRGGVMEKWKEEGRAALLAAERGGNGGDKEGNMMLLQGIKVIPKAEPEKKEKEKRKERQKGKNKKSSRNHDKDSKKEDPWSKLREERLRREHEEQKRQNEAVRSATLGSSGTGSGGGRRYNSTYGYGR